MDVVRKRSLIVSGGWIQGSIVVILIGFTILLYVAYRMGVDAPTARPIATIVAAYAVVQRGASDSVPG